MPREVIYDLAGQFNTVVRWDLNDGGVQLGIDTHDGQTLAEHLKESNGDMAPFRSIWGTLDRRGVNHLIRILRRARNQLFEADE